MGLTVRLVDVGAVVDEEFHGFYVPQHYCQVQRCVSKPIDLVYGIWSLKYAFVDIYLTFSSYSVMDNRRLATGR